MASYVKWSVIPAYLIVLAACGRPDGLVWPFLIASAFWVVGYSLTFDPAWTIDTELDELESWLT